MKCVGIICVFFIILLAIISFLPSNTIGLSPDSINLQDVLNPPSSQHFFGTDELGRDVLSRVIYGARISLLAALGAQIISFFIGTILGLSSGYYNGKLLDKIISFLMASFHGFPFLLFVLAITAALGPGIYNVMIAIGIVNWVGIARVTRGEVISQKERGYVLAASSFGFPRYKILFKHIFPNVIPSSIPVFILGFGEVVAVEAGLSFLGLGVQPPTASWGKMIFVGKDYITTAWWMSVFPGIFLVMIILSFNIIGEYLGSRWKVA